MDKASPAIAQSFVSAFVRSATGTVLTRDPTARQAATALGMCEAEVTRTHFSAGERQTFLVVLVGVSRTPTVGRPRPIQPIGEE